MEDFVLLQRTPTFRLAEDYLHRGSTSHSTYGHTDIRTWCNTLAAVLAITQLIGGGAVSASQDPSSLRWTARAQRIIPVGISAEPEKLLYIQARQINPVRASDKPDTLTASIFARVRSSLLGCDLPRS